MLPFADFRLNLSFRTFEPNNIMSTTISPRDAQWREELRKATLPKSVQPSAREMTELDPAYRITCNEEVNQGLTRDQAILEATRCLDCPDPTCVTGCP